MLLKYNTNNKISGGNISYDIHIQALNEYLKSKNITFEITATNIVDADDCKKTNELKKIIQEQSVILRDMHEFRKANKIYKEFSKINLIFRGINIRGKRIPNIVLILKQYPEFKSNMNNDEFILETNSKIDELLEQIAKLDEIKFYNQNNQINNESPEFIKLYTEIYKTFNEQNNKYKNNANEITKKVNTQYGINSVNESQKTNETEILIVNNISTLYKYLIIEYLISMNIGSFPSDGINKDKLIDKIKKEEILKDIKIYEHVSNGKYAIILYTYFELIFNTEIINN